ncbi:MAG: MotA/TolQ/ExbB proton channel family protein [Gammaproteobacteria bacterium]|nr:MotA/TolQ/ExbB proton channel family protein [Gammaproteobacteria bacterium]
MLKKRFPIDFFYMIVTLLLSVIIVHTIYTTVVRPQAEATLRSWDERWKIEPTYAPTRSVMVIVHDLEPEACFILTVWAGFILGFRWFIMARERALLEHEFIGLKGGQVIFPDDIREFSRQIEQLPDDKRRLFLPRALKVVMNRFGATRSVQHSASAARDECEFEASRLDAELSLIRFSVWAIPAVGFVGTVRGIGAALQQAQRAAAGDVTGVTHGLGITFNSTLVALSLCIVVMFFLHQLQLSQDRLVLDIKSYIDEHLIRHLRER